MKAENNRYRDTVAKIALTGEKIVIHVCDSVFVTTCLAVVTALVHVFRYETV